MKLDHAWIAARIPHQGSMCLLDEVLCWDEREITCRSGSHRAADNPLRAHQRLGAACAIEYAAQAVAVHGALLRPAAAAAGARAGAVGMIASAREVELAVVRLDDIGDDLLVGAQRQHGDARGALYTFALHGGLRLLARGRVSVLLP